MEMAKSKTRYQLKRLENKSFTLTFVRWAFILTNTFKVLTIMQFLSHKTHSFIYPLGKMGEQLVQFNQLQFLWL